MLLIYFQRLCQRLDFHHLIGEPIHLRVLNGIISLTAQVGEGRCLDEAPTPPRPTVMLNHSIHMVLNWRLNGMCGSIYRPGAKVTNACDIAINAMIWISVTRRVLEVEEATT